MIDQFTDTMERTAFKFINKVKNKGVMTIKCNVDDDEFIINIGGITEVGGSNYDDLKPAELLADFSELILSASIELNIGVSVELGKRCDSSAELVVTYCPECLAH